MSFAGYKLQFELNAKHRDLRKKNTPPHPHTFTIALYVKKRGGELALYENIEKDISSWLQLYQGKDLSSLSLFSDRNATLEAIGEVFYGELEKLTEPRGYELVRLDINENPTRTYSVSRKPLDHIVDELSAPAFFIPQCATDETSTDTDNRNEKKEPAPEPKPVQPVPVPISEERLLETGEETASPKGRIWKLFAALLFLLFCSVGTVYLIKINGLYPSGYDVWYHLYRSSSLCRSIVQGDWFPLYDRYLYNGVEPLRYWAPLPVYLMSLCQFLTGGMLDSYLLYIGLLFFTGGSGWLLFGWRYNRIGFSALAGALWFFAPDNLMVLFGSGNLLRAMVAALLPFFLYYVWRFLSTKKWRNMFPVMLFISLLFLCHSGEAGIVLICLLMFLLIHAIVNRRFTEHFLLILGILLSVLVLGLWLYPSVRGGLISMSGNDTQNMKSSFANGWTSLNPFARLGDKDSTYFGLSFFLLSIVGIFLGNKKTFPGFLTGILLYFGTTLSLYPLISKLPMANLLWMTRFITLALAFIFLSFLLWKRLKKGFVVFFCLLIALDSLPSFQYLCAQGNNRISDVFSAQLAHAEEISLTDAKAVTNQRMALLDLSTYGSFAPWYLAGTEPETSCTFGAAWSSAQTAGNIVQLNTAYSLGYYSYLFDRCLELGNDTVQLRISLLQNGVADIEKVVDAAQRLGYRLVKKTSYNLLFHKSGKGTFGVKTTYKGIAIGTSSRGIALLYPVFKETADPDLDHYSYDQLKQYSRIYLSGFTCQDRRKAEEMLKKLAAGGTEIYVDMNRVPTDPSTKTQKFLGVEAQNISFEGSFPQLLYAGTNYQLPSFSEDLSKWSTVYLTGLKKTDGYTTVNQKKIAFAGTGTDSHIHFLGFNLVYYAETGGNQPLQLLDRFFGLRDGELPERRTVPLTVTYLPDTITIQTNEDDVNTTLAWHDIFQSSRPVRNDGSLLSVDSGTTVIHLTYPYFWEGLCLSMTGILLSVLYFLFLYLFYKKPEFFIHRMRRRRDKTKGKHYSKKVQAKIIRTRGKHYV